MYKIRSTIIYAILVVIVLVVSTTLFVHRADALPPFFRPADPITQSNSLYVDSTEDAKAIGYSDSRKIVRDSKGNLYIAYRKLYPADSEIYRIFVAKSTDNGKTWFVTNDNQPIETVGDYIQRVPSLAIDSHDTLHVVWYGLDESTYGHDERQIKYVRSSDGGATWSTWENIAPVSGYQDSALWQEHPTIDIDANNVIYVVWQGSDTRQTHIKFVKSEDGGATWSTWNTISPTQPGIYSRPVLLAANEGHVLYLLAYRNIPERQVAMSHSQIVWSRSTDGGATWLPWATVAGDEQDQRHISAALDTQNRLHIVWRQIPVGAASTAKAQIHYARFDGKRWTRPEIPAAQPDQNQFFPSITLDNKNTPWIVWTATPASSGYPKDDPTTGLIYYTTRTQGAWHDPIRLTNRTSTYASLIRQISPANQAIDVVWLENQAPTGGVICYNALSRAFHLTQAKPANTCEVAGPDDPMPTSTPTPEGTPTKTPKPTSTKTRAPTKTPNATKTARFLLTHTPTPTEATTPVPGATETPVFNPEENNDE